MYEQLLESIDCPLCGSRDSSAWATENGFSAVKCSSCGLVFVNPRPNTLDISAANKIGVHRTEGGALEVSYHRHPRRVERYRKLIAEIFADEISSHRVLRWLDVGAGYGELIEAATLALPNGSTICGIDPMEPKVRAAQARGLDVSTRSLSEVTGPFDVISLINVFSHVPDFRQFCSELKGKLAPNGLLFIQTGNGGDLKRRADYPDELCLPDHLVFAGREHIERYLNLAGFELTTVKNRRVDGIIGSVQTMLNNMRRGVFALRFPYTSPFRTVFYKAILRAGADGDVRAP